MSLGTRFPDRNQNCPKDSVFWASATSGTAQTIGFAAKRVPVLFI